MKKLMLMTAFAFAVFTVNAQTVATGKTLSAAEVATQYPELYTGMQIASICRNDGMYIETTVHTVPADKITMLGNQMYSIIHPAAVANSDGSYDMLMTIVYGDKNTDVLLKQANKWRNRSIKAAFSMSISQKACGQYVNDWRISAYGGPSKPAYYKKLVRKGRITI
jgi:hypothetical protein